MQTGLEGKFGSYSNDDVIFLLKDLSDVMKETATEDREHKVQSGTHYSEMLPIEFKPSADYKKLFFSSLKAYKKQVALAVGVVAEQILLDKGQHAVLVSLARAGTPIGILIKRYIQFKYHLQLPHYSVSIIRGRGIDENAMAFIWGNHPNQPIQFIDGWTGKGAIALELNKAVEDLNEKYRQSMSATLAVLADPGHCTSIYGTRDDFLIPSACLNATVSGLVSRTVLNNELISPDDFHGAKFYKELEQEDVSHFFIDTISEQFPAILDQVDPYLHELMEQKEKPAWKGLSDVKAIQETFTIADINLIKPGVGETTRVLLRRVPWKVLVKDRNDTKLAHIILLAKERGALIEEYHSMAYSCCGLIKPLDHDA